MSEHNGSAALPTFGIFGPTRQLNYGISVDSLQQNDSNGSLLEFCTDDMNPNLEKSVLLEDKYFGTPDMMKCSYLLDDLATVGNEDESEPTFESLAARMTNVVEDGGVKKAILSEGVGITVPAEARVRAHYHAFLEDMIEPFDSSYLQGKELKITLGKGHVIPGLDLAIATMRKCEKSRFLVQSQYAYGASGCPPRIPENTSILFEVELLGYIESSILDECTETEDERSNFTFQKVSNVAKAEKNEGNDLFQRGLYAKAQRKFMRCINAMESVRLKGEAEEAEMIKIVAKAYQNMGLCALKMGHFGKALAAGRRVLEHDPDHSKSLYIAGKALRHIGDFAQSRKFMLRARKFAPSSNDVAKELKLIDEAEEKFRRAEVNMCRKMFSGGLASDVRETDGQQRVCDNTRPGSRVTAAFQRIIRGRLGDFLREDSAQDMCVPIGTFTQREVYCAAEIAEEMGFHVEFVDKPGMPKQLKIFKQDK